MRFGYWSLCLALEYPYTLDFSVVALSAFRRVLLPVARPLLAVVFAGRISLFGLLSDCLEQNQQPLLRFGIRFERLSYPHHFHFLRRQLTVLWPLVNLCWLHLAHNLDE